MIDLLLRTALSNLVIAGVLALVAWVVQRKGEYPRAAHVLWLLVLVKLLTPPVLTLPLLTIPTQVAPVPVAAVAVPGRIGVEAAVVPGFDGVHPGYPAGISGASGASIPWGRLALGIWLLGSAMLFLWSLVRIIRFHRLLGRAADVAPAGLQRIANGLAEHLVLRPTPTLYTTEARVTPLVWWVGGRVRVVLPGELVRTAAPEHLEWIVAHELAHVRRRDHLVRWLEWLTCVLCWWNPIAWWARRNLRRNEEVCTDDLVLATLDPDPRAYAGSLLAAVEFLSAPALRPPAMASGINGGGFLERRLKMIVSANRRKATPRGARAALLLGVLAILPLGIAQADEPDYEAVGDRLMEAVREGELTAPQAEAMMAELARARFQERMQVGGRRPEKGIEGYYKRLGIDHAGFVAIRNGLLEKGLKRDQLQPALGGMLRVVHEMKAEGERFQLDPALLKYFLDEIHLGEGQIDVILGYAKRILLRLERQGAPGEKPSRAEMARVKKAIWAHVESGEVTEEAAQERWEGYLKRFKDDEARVRGGEHAEHTEHAEHAKHEERGRGEGLEGRFRQLGIDGRIVEGIRKRTAEMGMSAEQTEVALGVTLRLVYGMKEKGDEFALDAETRERIQKAGDFTTEQGEFIIGMARRLYAGLQPGER